MKAESKKKATKKDGAKIPPPPSNDTKVYPDMSRQEREKAMAATCFRVVIEDFNRKLSEDDLAAEDSGYTRNAMSVADLKGKLKEITATYKTQIKALEAVMEAGLEVIASGSRKVNGKLFLYPDFQSNRMRYFDVYGDFIYSRPLTIDERQTKLALGDGTAKYEADNGGETLDVEHVEVVDTGKPGDTSAGITIETQTVEPAAQPGPDKKAKKAAKAKQNARVEGEVADLNDKVAGMINTQKTRRANIDAKAKKASGDDAVQGNVQEDTATSGDVGGDKAGTQTDIPASNAGEFQQIPREETKIDPGAVPPLDDHDDDGLPV